MEQAMTPGGLRLSSTQTGRGRQRNDRIDMLRREGYLKKERGSGHYSPTEAGRTAQARTQQARVDDLRKVSGLAADVSEFLDAEAEPDVLARRIKAMAKRLGTPDAVRDDLLKAVETGDPDKIKAAIAKAERDAGLTPIGTPGASTKFDRTQHKAIGAPIRDGASVSVVRPGHRVDLDGVDKLLEKAVVEELSETPTPEPLSADPAVREVQVENRIRAYFRDHKIASGWASIAGLRDSTPDVDRDELDSALERLAVTPGVQVIPWDNLKALSQADRDAALRFGGQDNHAFRFEDPSPRPLPTTEGAPPKGEAARAAKKVAATPIPPISGASAEYVARKQAVEDIARRNDLSVSPLATRGGVTTTLETAPDGKKIVRKDFSGAPQAKHNVDAEELGPLIMGVAGIDSPAATRIDEKTIAEEFLEGETGDSIVPYGQSVPQSILDSDDARLIGLIDYATSSADRNPGNWMQRPSGRIGTIDFADMFPGDDDPPGIPWGLNGDFSRYLAGESDADGNPQLGSKVDLSAEDLELVRQRIRDLRPAFAARGRLKWHRQIMKNLDDLVGRTDPGAKVRLKSPNEETEVPEPATFIDSLEGLDERLRGLGRRAPSNSNAYRDAARDLARGEDPKDVAKKLRAAARDESSPEDKETLRLLANDLTRKKAEKPSYLGPDNSVDLEEFGRSMGADITPFLDPTRDPMPLVHGPLEQQFPHSYSLYRIIDGLANGKLTPKKAIEELRDLSRVVKRRAEITDERTKGRVEGYKTTRDTAEIDQGRKLSPLLADIADRLEATRLPPRKRGVTLAPTTLAEPVPVDESRFTSIPLKGGLVRHRGEEVPTDFKHVRTIPLSAKAGEQLRPGLTDDENRALDLYTSVEVADKLNPSLRQGRMVHGTARFGRGGEADLDDVQRHLDSAIENSELSQDAILWRGSLVRSSDLSRLVPGAIYRDPAYLSTSTDEGAVSQIIRRRAEQMKTPGKKPVVFKILAPAGTRGALGHEDVSEFVLGRGQDFRVVRVDTSGEMPVVIMEVVQDAPGSSYARGRQLLDSFEYESPSADPNRDRRGDHLLAGIQQMQGFDGTPEVLSPDEFDTFIKENGSTELWRGFRDSDDEKLKAGDLLEQYRSGALFSGNPGAYGSGTYAGDRRATAESYGTALLRMALRRGSRVIKYDDLVRLQEKASKSKAGAELDRLQRQELSQVDPSDTEKVTEILRRFEQLRSKMSAKNRTISDLGRFAALLGYDAVYVPAGQAGKKAGAPAEYVIVNRTATVVEGPR